MTAAVTASDAPTTEATPAGETTAAVAEDKEQDSNRLAEFEAKLRDVTEQLEAAKAATAEAREDAKREEAIRKGIQRESTPKLQEYAKLQKQLASQTISVEKLDRLERLTEVLLTQNMDEDQRKRVLGDIENERIRKENEFLKAAQQQPAQQQAAARQLDPGYKQELKDYWFKSHQVDPQDPRIDWATDAPDTGTWYERTKQSFDRIAAEAKATAKPAGQEDLAALVARQVEEATEKLRKEYEDRFSQSQAELQEQRAKTEEAERVATEAAKRKKGADRESTPPAATAAKQGRLADIPKDWAYDPEKKKEVSALLNNKNYRDDLAAQVLKQQKTRSR